MDLTSFTSSKSSKNSIIKDNEDVFIEYKNDSYHIIFRTKKGLKTYQDYLFLSPTTSITTDSLEKAEAFFKKSLEEGCEGVMAKALDAPYVSGLRSGNMAKVKEAKEDLDVVIVAAEHGKGKRAGYYSSFYVAVKDDEEFFTIGKVASGIKELDDQGVSMKNLTDILNSYKINEENNITYFEPRVVLQIRYQEIQPSTIYSSGYALRFPRMIMLRDDKRVEEINSIDDIKNLL